MSWRFTGNWSEFGFFSFLTLVVDLNHLRHFVTFAINALNLKPLSKRNNQADLTVEFSGQQCEEGISPGEYICVHVPIIGIKSIYLKQGGRTDLVFTAIKWRDRWRRPWTLLHLIKH